MSWVAVGGAVAGAAATSLMNKGGGGGNGGATTTESKTPWEPAQPWIMSNLQTGQNLQGYYQQNPFNALQQGSYANLLGNNDYINQMVPGMLGQFSQQQGFDRNNPRAQPMAIQFPQMQPRAPMAGLLNAPASAGGNMNITQNPFANGLLSTAPAAAPAAPPSGPATYNISAPQGMLNYVRTLGYDNTGGGG